MKASPTVRRLFNQAFFEWIKISAKDVADVALAEPFHDLLADDLMEELAPAEPEKTTTPAIGDSLVSGSIKGEVVGTAGFEPATSRV